MPHRCLGCFSGTSFTLTYWETPIIHIPSTVPSVPQPPIFFNVLLHEAGNPDANAPGHWSFIFSWLVDVFVGFFKPCTRMAVARILRFQNCLGLCSLHYDMYPRVPANPNLHCCFIVIGAKPVVVNAVQLGIRLSELFFLYPGRQEGEGGGGAGRPAFILSTRCSG